MQNIGVGDYVQGGEGKDFEIGRVLAVDVEDVLVGWPSGVRTWQHKSTVEPSSREAYDSWINSTDEA